jgi:DNA-binding beta-propeller fold protein YncE
LDGAACSSYYTAGDQPLSIGMKIDCRATDRASAIVASLGRTEDVRFSPDNRRLAIAAFNKHRIAILDVEVSRSGGSPGVQLTGGIEISSSAVRYPHGVDFLDDETIVVSSREGGVAIFKLPVVDANDCDLTPIQFLPSGGSIIRTPGSVSVVPGEDGLCELLVCNNYADNVSRHIVDRNAGCSIAKSEVLLRKWLNLPDGVCVSRDGRWIAISNHNTHGGLIYERSALLNEESSPVGVFRGVSFPHGMRFSADGRHLFLADAGAPFVHVYACGDHGWHGTRMPAASIRMMDEQAYRRGRNNPEEGGPKGIDLDKSMTVLATTCEHQRLQFLDAAAMLAAASAGSPVMDVEYELGTLAFDAEHKALASDVAEAKMVQRRIRELELLAAHQERRAEKFKAKAARQKARAARAKAKAGLVIGGKPRRITAPLSWLIFAFKRPN